mmetsp:Transcript_37247/g.57197  ORF Transcript_37247/g.57197 Transcript_37247/m.57197 type:complete len:216 (+) Transcript_37247:1272-1919(+)
MVLLATQWSYGFSTKPIPCRTVTYNSYQSRAEQTNPYKALSNWTNNVLLPPSVITDCLNDGFMVHKISTIFPVRHMITKSSMSGCRYAPGTSAVDTSLRSLASIMRDMKNASSTTVGDAVCSLVYSPCCFLPSAHVRPLIRPHLFCLMRLIARSADSFCWCVRLVGSMAPKTFWSFSWVNSRSRASTASCPNMWMPFSTPICVKQVCTRCLYMWE